MCDVTGLTPGMWTWITWVRRLLPVSPKVTIFPLWLRNTVREMHPDSANPISPETFATNLSSY